MIDIIIRIIKIELNVKTFNEVLSLLVVSEMCFTLPILIDETLFWIRYIIIVAFCELLVILI